MAFGSPRRKTGSLNVFFMLVALVIAAFLGAAAGLIWQNSGWFTDGTVEEEVVMEDVAGT